MCYSISMAAYVVVVMDTQFYNGQCHAYEDYPVADILHMVGLANRPAHDQDGTSIGGVLGSWSLGSGAMGRRTYDLLETRILEVQKLCDYIKIDV